MIEMAEDRITVNDILETINNFSWYAYLSSIAADGTYRENMTLKEGEILLEYQKGDDKTGLIADDAPVTQRFIVTVTEVPVDGICRFCHKTIIVDNYETWIDNTGGDVCPSASLDPGENRPHEPFETSYS